MAMDIPNVIVIASWMVVFAVYLVLGFTNKRTVVRDRAGSRIWYNGATALSYAMMFNPTLWGRVLSTRWLARGQVAETIGAVVAVAGGALAIWARLSLGRNWSAVVTVKQDHALVRVGPYRWIRHPIYTGLITAMAGTALINARWSGILAVAIMALAFLFKSQIEERFMRRTFGVRYDEYCTHTGAFLPRI